MTDKNRNSYEMSIKKFSDYVKGKDNGMPSPFSEPDPGIQSADMDGDEEPHGFMGSPQMLSKEQPPLTRVDKSGLATPEYKKGDGLKGQKESTESSEEILNEEKDYDSNFLKSHLGERFTPSLSETTRYIANLAAGNPNVNERLIRDFKRHGAFEGLMSEMMNHNETFDGLTNHLSHKDNGKKHARKLVSSMKNHHENYHKEHFMGESVDMPRGDSGFGNSMSPMSNPMPGSGFSPSSSGAGFGMAQSMASPVPGMAPSSQPQVFTTPSSAQGSMGALPAVSAPAPSATEAKSNYRGAYHNLISEMVSEKYPMMQSYCKECMGGY